MFSFWIFWILEVALTYKMTEITLFVNVVYVLGFIYQCELVINQYSFYLSYFIYYFIIFLMDDNYFWIGTHAQKIQR